jgi:hypothetical protein
MRHKGDSRIVGDEEREERLASQAQHMSDKRHDRRAPTR